MRAVGAEPSAQLVAPTKRDAATVILVSDRPDLHVLMLERTSRAVFGPGATVFPGGAVDPDDAAVALVERTAGIDDPAASTAQGMTRGGLAFRGAALRECCEEGGPVRARHAASGVPAAPDDGPAPARPDLNGGPPAFGALPPPRGLSLPAAGPRVSSRWLPPPGAPRRYNTW